MADDAVKEFQLWSIGNYFAKVTKYAHEAGCEEEIYEAADAAYDTGARNIIAWSYRGGEAVDYKADCCDVVWQVTGDAMRRLRDRYQDDVRADYRRRMGL